MSDERRHRGPHPADHELFAPEVLPALRQATAELSWLFQRGYGQSAALKLVGDHFGLRERQRLAILRCACGDDALAARSGRRVVVARLRGISVAVDGFNCLITCEAALSGGLVLRGRDRALRDLASIHGSYRHVEETERAVRMVGDVLAEQGAGAVTWFLDRPVSNSGRLRGLLEDVAAAAGWTWVVELVDNPDKAIVESGSIAASSDSWVMDHAAGWVCLPETVLAKADVSAWIVDLG
jgi:hypothetical protein